MFITNLFSILNDDVPLLGYLFPWLLLLDDDLHSGTIWFWAPILAYGVFQTMVLDFSSRLSRVAVVRPCQHTRESHNPVEAIELLLAYAEPRATARPVVSIID